MMTVTELAKQSGTTAHAVRYYTRMGLLSPTRNPDNGYRLYKMSEVNWLKFIRQAKALGYTLHEIQEIMQDREAGHSPCQRVRAILQNRIVENRKHLQELMALQERMEKALLDWADMPDAEPESQTVCPLIESVISPETENMQ
jgi:DNA-binding transcriptional MerR regulator